jgi:hypothetical protein
MKTSELLKYVATDLLDDRKDQVSGETDVLFPDALIARHLAEAERILCRRAWVLEDTGASAATRIQLVEGRTDYPLHKSVLFVKSVRLSDTDVDLLRAGYDDNRARGSLSLQAPGFWDVNAVYIENAGRPSRFSTDVGTRTIRVRAKPDAEAAALKLNLVVVRMPINAISHTTPDAEPECPEEFHMDLTRYAAGMCLIRPSVESELRALGRQYVSEFDARVLEAKRDRQRLQQSPPRHRFGAWASDSYAE